MKIKKAYTLPQHMEGKEGGLPRSHSERILWIKRKVEEGYYDTERVKIAVAEAFLNPSEVRRAGDNATPGGRRRPRNN